MRSATSTAVALAIVAVLLFPLYWMINIALQPGSSLAALSPVPDDAGLGGFAAALRDQGGAMATSLAIALGAAVLCLAISAPAAYALGRFRLRGARLVLFGSLVAQMVPDIVVANAVYNAYVDLRLVNSYLGLILADAALGIPFATVLLRAFMAGLPGEVLEAAMVDGANRLRTFVSVVVPMSRNALITGGVFAFLFAWSDFLFALTLNTTDDVKPVTLAIYDYLGVDTTDWSAVMATAVLASLPAAVLLVFAQRHIVSGISGGSVK
ncbi:carbohydrate ABC transporter permease [Saccharopolyspora griseoalba]|uniref:Carbohydrate ABC transporter permease n=1 Tax=Saccharopolyspora griseoalba TaxID=1431848 RepID=A0ABW2LPL5_9PSEU